MGFLKALWLGIILKHFTVNNLVVMDSPDSL